ncbi:hypothetical protein JCM6882_008393 [Rhodosporidiobolus microsporus]
MLHLISHHPQPSAHLSSPLHFADPPLLSLLQHSPLTLPTLLRLPLLRSQPLLRAPLRPSAFKPSAPPTSTFASPTAKFHNKMSHDANCIFCKIVKGEIPSLKLIETDSVYSFLDIGPIAKGHSLVIPKYHGAKLHDIPDEHLVEVLATLKKIAVAQGVTDYNILQNNGRIAHQVVDHVHFHMIPKPSASDSEGLVIGWPTKQADKDELKKLQEEILSKL